MTQPISFFAQGIPKGQPRPRAFAKRTKGGGFTARVFDAGTAEHWKSQIAIEARKHKPATELLYAVVLSLAFHFPRPVSHYRGKAKALREDAPKWHTGKPDADNLAKAVMDALTQLGGFWRDDCQVSHLYVSKAYCATQADAGVWITISPA